MCLELLSIFHRVYTYIRRMEIAMIIRLVWGCSPTHVLITNRIWPWSDVAFWRYYTRNASVRLLQSSDKTINFWTALTVDVKNLSQISKLHCKTVHLFLYYASKYWRQTTLFVLNSTACILSFSPSNIRQNHEQNMYTSSSIPDHTLYSQAQSRMTRAALRRPLDQYSLPSSCLFDILNLQISLWFSICPIFDMENERI